MSNLTLRVTGKKKKRPIKRQAEGLDDLKILFKSLSIDIADSSEFECLYEATSIDKQVAALRKIFSDNFTNGEINTHQVLVIENLLNIYLGLQLKSPLKGTMTRLLINLPHPFHQVVCAKLAQLLCKRFDESSNEAKDIIANICSLSGCFENFSIGVAAVISCKDKAIQFLESSLRKCHALLLMDGPPAKKVPLLSGIHSAVRCAIVLIQKARPNCTNSLLHLSIELLIETRIPLDVRTTCAILSVLVAKDLNGQQGWNKILVDFYSCDDSLSSLCIFTGMLTTLTDCELATEINISEKRLSVFKAIFEQIIAIGDKHASDSCTILSVTRLINLISKTLVGSPMLLERGVFEHMLLHVWNHLEHYMDSVRHLASNTLSNLVTLAAGHKEENLTDVITEAVDKLPADRRSKHVALSTLVGLVPISNILLKSPDLVETLLTTIQESSGATHAMSTWESLMRQHYHEAEDQDTWVKLWVKPLIKYIEETPNPALEHALSMAIELRPDIIDTILSFENGKAKGNLSTAGLVCLRFGRKAGLYENVESDNWKGLVEYELLSKCLYHRSSELRLACLALLTECHKTTEALSRKELELIKTFLIYNINNENSAVKQKSMASLKKFLTRFKESSYALERVINQNALRPPEVKGKDVSLQEEILSDYKDFLAWLFNFCFENLFPGANFSRRGTVLNILILCKELGFWTEQFHTPDAFEILFQCLSDSYEENKALAVDLITDMSPTVFRLNDAENLEMFLKDSLALTSSIKPHDCITAAYLFKLVTAFPSINNLLEDIVLKEEGSKNFFQISEVLETGYFSCLTLLIIKLENELLIAKSSLLKASSQGPLYGQLFVIRNLLQTLDFRKVSRDPSWKYLLSYLVNLAFDCNQIVACIVNSSSPEGHLPMDFDYDMSSLGSGETKVTAQMVLLCSWRTVKEVSLLLGEIAERAPISEGESSLLSQKQILAIGDHLTTLLAETKHRGAFEQAYVGFCKLAATLWRFPEGDLHELPSKWLKETLQEITTSGKLCATRRSAGIPFMIQGLVCTELEVGEGRCFENSMKTLLELGARQEGSQEARTHAMNILRSLFRNSQLGEMVSPYVPQGIALAIQGFSANTWSERNSATLLLSALMTRVFGVPRSRVNLNWRNKMTGRIFFLRYPSLFSVILHHLQSASQGSLQSPLYPVLLILGRLYPSSLEGTDSNLQLSKYIPYINDCAGSCILKTRSLAASAMVALITPNKLVDHIKSVFDEILICDKQNRIHGLLLQVFCLLKFDHKLPDDILGDLQQLMPTWSEIAVDIVNTSGGNFMLKDASLKVLSQIAIKFYSYVDENVWLRLVMKIENDLFYDKEDPKNYIGFHVFQSNEAFVYLLLKTKSYKSGEFAEGIVKLLMHNSYDVYNMALDFINYLFSGENENLEDDTLYILNLIELTHKEELKKEIRTSDLICDILFKKLKLNCHHEDKLKVLSVIKVLPLAFEYLSRSGNSVVLFFHQICTNEHELVAAVAFQCISALLTSHESYEFSQAEEDSFCDLLVDFSCPDADFDCRFAASELLLKNFIRLVAKFTLLNVIKLWTSLITLLCDDIEEIRNLMAGILGEDVMPSKAVEIYLRQFVHSNLETREKIVVLIAWALGNSAFNFEPLQENEDRVFDKGEMNIYHEELIINKLVCEHLKSIIEDCPGILEEELPEVASVWLLNYCSIKSQDIKTKTISGLIRFFESTLLGKKLNSASKYLLTLAKRDELFEIKLKNLLNVLSYVA